MRLRLQRMLTVVTLLSMATMVAPAQGLAARDGDQQPTRSEALDVLNDEIDLRLQDPYTQAALRLIAHGFLEGRMLPNGELTIRPNQPMTGGATTDLLVRALGKERLARNLDLRLSEGATDAEWSRRALAAMQDRLVAWGAPVHRGSATSFEHQPISAAESIAMLAVASGVQPPKEATWPTNLQRWAVHAGFLSVDHLAELSSNSSRGLVFYLFDRAFYNYDLGAGETYYTKYACTAVAQIDPYPTQTGLSEVTLTGTATGMAKMEVRATASTQGVTLLADGAWSVTVPLSMGANLITIDWLDREHGRCVQDPPVIINRVPFRSIRNAEGLG